MDRTMTYYDLLEAFAEEGCPVCRLGLAAVQRSIDAIDYESAGDPAIHDQLRASLGFCNVHAHQWLRRAHVLATAVIYADVLTRSVEDLRARAFPRAPRLAAVAAFFTPPGHPHGSDPVPRTGACPLCHVLAEAVAALTATLLTHLADEPFRRDFAQSAGLCLPHLGQALAAATPDAAATLRDVAVAHEELLLAQLQEVIRRHDYRSIGEPPGPERGAAERAVCHLIGAPGIPT